MLRPLLTKKRASVQGRRDKCWLKNFKKIISTPKDLPRQNLYFTTPHSQINPILTKFPIRIQIKNIFCHRHNRQEISNLSHLLVTALEVKKFRQQVNSVCSTNHLIAAKHSCKIRSCHNRTICRGRTEPHLMMVINVSHREEKFATAACTAACIK